MRPTATFFVLLVLALVVGPAAGQATYATLHGTVFDDETGEPLPGVHVFIAASMIGTTTNTDGSYRLERVPRGAHRLYVSMVGFEPVLEEIVISEAEAYSYTFNLRPGVYEMDSVVIVAERDRLWKRRLEKFSRLFIGETPFARKTMILNPEVLGFTDEDGIFSACGLRREGHLERVKPESLLHDGPVPVLKELSFQSYLEIEYAGEEEDLAYLNWINQTRATPGLQESWIFLETPPALVDIYGNLIDPYTVTMSGYLAFSRVADMLPKEYRP